MALQERFEFVARFDDRHEVVRKPGRWSRIDGSGLLQDRPDQASRLHPRRSAWRRSRAFDSSDRLRMVMLAMSLS